MAAAKRLNAQAHIDEKCRGQNCCGELVLVLRSRIDAGEWWRCHKCKAFNMSPFQKENEGFWWGGPMPPIRRTGRPHATLNEQRLRAKQGLRVYSVDASIWLHGPVIGQRFAELGLSHAEAFVMRQVRDRLSLLGQKRLAKLGD